MKKILILCYTVLIAAFILPLFFRKLPEEKEAPLTLPELQQSARQDAAASETASAAFATSSSFFSASAVSALTLILSSDAFAIFDHPFCQLTLTERRTI